MKNPLNIFLLMIFALQLSAQSYVDKKGKTHLWGNCNLTQLKSGDYQEWYQKNYDEFDSALTAADGELFKDVKVKVFLGTWCGDTKYLVPKFVKCWEQMNLSEEQIEFIGVHNGEGKYKQGPQKETEGMNIHRVPTFVFEKGGEEIGRIVERTVFDLDTDMKTIVQGHPYLPRYRAVQLLDGFFQETVNDSLDTKTALNTAYRKIRREVSTASELNTYGYVLLAQDKLEQSAFVLKLNRYLFPYTPNTRDSYGEILMKQKKYKAAREEYLEALRLAPELETAIAKLAELNELIKTQKEVES